MLVNVTPGLVASALVVTNTWPPTAITTWLPSAAATSTSPLPGKPASFRHVPAVLGLPQVLRPLTYRCRRCSGRA